MLHKETHSFEKYGKNYELKATVYDHRTNTGTAYYIELRVVDLEPIVTEWEHYRTGEPMRLTRFDTWSLKTDDFYNLQEAKDWTAKKLNKIIKNFNSGKNPRWEQEY